MGLVYTMAKSYSATNMEHEDLVQEGMFGLMDAAVRFDPARGVKFSTYAAWHIRKTIMEAIRSRNDIVRTPRRQPSRTCTPLDTDRPTGETAPPPDEMLGEIEEQQKMTQMVHDGLRCLSDREALVVQLRHGVNAPEPMTLRAVGKLFGITPERVRQIQASAEKKLRTHLEGRATLD